MKTLKLFIILILIACFSNNIVKADFIFGEPTKVPNINSDSYDCFPQISRDGLELYFTSKRNANSNKIWVSRRSAIDDPWSEPVKLDDSVNGVGTVTSPSLSADGLELYFARNRNLWISTRQSKDDPWDEPIELEAPVKTGNWEGYPCISADGLELYFLSDRPGGGSNPTNTDIFVTTRPTQDSPWGEPVKLSTNVNSNQYETTPFISSDGLLLFFVRGYSKEHIYLSRRTTITEPWGSAEFFTPINSGSAGDIWGSSPGEAELSASFAEGDSTIYFSRGTSVHSSDWNIWQMEATPIVDFNSDGIVDTKDVCLMVDFWHTSESRCDIAPAPLGDGIVDIQDLIVLAEHLFEDIPIP